jgi:8-oxo-dGTP pyrophosphatase MutT (NUDIX family)
MIKKVVTLIVLCNSSVILQLRDNKSHISYPEKWGYFSGSLNKGEDYFHAAKRECREELGINSIKEIKFQFTYYQSKTKTLFYVFTVVPSLNKIVLKEGLDYDFFFYKDFVKGFKFSKKKKKNFKIAEDEVMLKFYNKLSLTIK